MVARKRLRLDLENYAVPGSVWHVTTPTRNREPCFRDDESCAAIVESLHFHCAKRGADLLLYCLMPNHLHAVIAIGDGDLVAVMQGFKSYTTSLWRRAGNGARLWQDSFHDHGIRRTENMDELIQYITENPQRAGLVAEWTEYRWIGGSLLEDA